MVKQTNKTKKKKKPEPANEGKSGGIYKKGGKHFILPKKEIKQLGKQGKFSDPIEHSEAEKEERRQTEISNIAKKSVDIEREKEIITKQEEMDWENRDKTGEPLLEEQEKPKDVEEGGLELKPEGETNEVEKGFIQMAISDWKNDPKLFFNDLAMATGVATLPKIITKIPAVATLTIAMARQMVTHAPTIAQESYMGLTKYSGRAGDVTKGKYITIASEMVRRGVANNGKNYGLKVSYLTKLVSTSKNPVFLLGLLGTTLYTSLFWAPNEKGDALMTLTITQGQAAKSKQWDKVYEIGELIKETEAITASFPVIGFIRAEWAKFKAAAKASEVYTEQADKASKKDEMVMAEIEKRGGAK